MQYKQQSRLDEKRKKAMDLHLSFIVDQTEKYSSWLTEGFAGGASRSMSVASSSLPTSPSHSVHFDGKHKNCCMLMLISTPESFLNPILWLGIAKCSRTLIELDLCSKRLYRRLFGHLKPDTSSF